MTMVLFAALLVVLAGRLLYLGSGIPERVGGRWPATARAGCG